MVTKHSISLLLILLSGTIFSWGQKPELRVQVGHSNDIICVAISPDGQYVLTGSRATVKLWNIKGRLLLTFPVPGAGSLSFSPDGEHILINGNMLTDYSGNILQSFPEASVGAFSPDGKYLLTGNGKKAILRDQEGRQLRRFNGHKTAITSVAFSPNGQYLLTSGYKETITILWDIDGKKLQRFGGINGLFAPDGQLIITSWGSTIKYWHPNGQMQKSYSSKENYIGSMAISPDGQSLLLNGSKLIDHSGNLLQAFEGGYMGAFSEDGQQLLTGSTGHEAILWSLKGEELQRFTGFQSNSWSVDFSPDGQYLLAGGDDNTAKLWNFKQGKLERSIDHSSTVTAVAFSNDGKSMLTGSGDGAIKLLNSSGDVIQSFKDAPYITSVNFSPDQQYLLTSNIGAAHKMWDLKGNKLVSFPDSIDARSTSAFSPDGQYVLTGTSLKLWSLDGEELQMFPLKYRLTCDVAFSPSGKYVLSGHPRQIHGNGHKNAEAKLWDRSGKELVAFKGHSGNRISVAFSPDEQYVLTGGLDRSAQLWDLNGKLLHRLEGRPNGVMDVTFSPDGQTIVTVGRAGGIKLWNTSSGQLMAELYAFNAGRGWVAITPDGYFDGDEAGLRNLHYVVGREAIPLDRLKERYYEPGLLAKIMGFNKETLRDVTAFDSVALYPAIELSRHGDQLKVSLSKRSGGIGRTALYINGSEKVADLNPARAAQFTINLQDYRQFFYARQPNTIGIKSYNEAGWLGSQMETAEYLPAQPTSLQLNTKPRIYALCVGTADYARGNSLDLAYAEQDAQRLAQALELGGTALLGDPTRVEVLTLRTCLDSDCPPDTQRPTKKNIQATLAALALKARPEDVFLLYLSGHGKVYHDYFYYLTQDMGSDYLADDAIRQQYAISSAEFAEWLNAIPARKQVMMIDACSSGQFNEDMALLAMKAIPGSQVRALDRLRDRTGIFIISGSANDQASYEASPYGMGLLTYTLLAGMSGGALREEEYMDVEKLFSFAEEQVPVLAEDVGAIQTPKYWKPEGSKSFDIGRATAAVKAQIQLPSPKPVFVRARFINNETFGDELKLEATLNTLMRDFAFAKGQNKALLFVDADDHPNAFRLSGRYTHEGNKVSVEYSVFKGNKAIGERLMLEMEASDMKEIGRKIISQAYAVVQE